MRKPEEEFAMLNMLAKLFEALNKMSPDNPEGVVLRAMAKNFVTQETAPALNTGQPINAQKPDEFRNAEFVNAMKALAMKVSVFCYLREVPRIFGGGLGIGSP